MSNLLIYTRERGSKPGNAGPKRPAPQSRPGGGVGKGTGSTKQGHR